MVARRLEEVALGIASGAPLAPNPMARMRDTIVFGYLMASAKEPRVDVPEWWAARGSGGRARRRWRAARQRRHVAG